MEPLRAFLLTLTYLEKYTHVTYVDIFHYNYPICRRIDEQILLNLLFYSKVYGSNKPEMLN